MRRTRATRKVMDDELTLAIGLVWGHLNTGQFEQAYDLARGCLRIWPDATPLILMVAYAAVELMEPLDEKMLAVLKESECKEWARLVLRRADIHAAADHSPKQDSPQ